MESLFEKATQPNELNEELLKKINLYRNDHFSAKIKPEYNRFSSINIYSSLKLKIQF